MRYTRYDMKRKKEGKGFAFRFVLVLLFAFVLGSVMWKLVFKNGPSSSSISKNIENIKNNKNQSNNEKGTQGLDEKTMSFIAVQGGLYADKNNAQNQKAQLSQYGTAFSVDEEGKVRVFLGIYTEERGTDVMKSLTDQKVDNSKIKFTINKNDVCDGEIVEILNANIQILNKLSEKDVKAIQTDELKKWCLSLKKVDNGKNLAVLNELKSYVNKLPKETTKDKAEENYVYIYGIMKKIAEKK